MAFLAGDIQRVLEAVVPSEPSHPNGQPRDRQGRGQLYRGPPLWGWDHAPIIGRAGRRPHPAKNQAAPLAAPAAGPSRAHVL
jgi:hypothetical protein